ncbi:site-specific integrase [Acidiplasma cupricumulans]|uniref:Integrase n=2 Tax=Acidiplasma cupricumulans TaxID=312540 RepID=A0A0Q0VXP7_9ARCH|nr:site-specific integrase [Acidiplasma cupricumulans]KQB36495.1 integrase [Acidiplasma cupricumulans]
MDARISQEYTALKKEKIPENDKKNIINFVNDLELEGISEIRRKNYIQRLRIVARWIPDKFLNPDRNDLRIVREHLENGYINNGIHKKYSEWTKTTYMKMLKKFYRYILSSEKFNELFRNVKINSNPGSKIKPDQIIQPWEIRKMVDSATNTRDRALLYTLYDSGCRIGEIITMKIKDLEFDEYGCIIKVSGKTGYRNVRIVGNSIPYIRAWLDSHPFKNDRNAWLFCNLESNIKGRMLEYHNVYAIIRNSIRNAGLDPERRIYPHLFRHTRATILATKLNEVPLENQMGWVHGSKMTSVYVHVSGRDQDNAVLKAYGMKVEAQTDLEEKPIRCPRCNEINDSNAKYCRRCWLPFDEKLALEFENKEKEIESTIEKSNIIPGIAKKMIENAPESFKAKLIENVLEEILKDPEMLKKFRTELK